MRTINKLGLAAVCAGAAATGMAQEVGRVISTQPVLQQVAVPRQMCNTAQVAVQPQKSGAGALLGALAGGAVGNQIGQGAGNAAATMIGIMGGAILGDRVEGSPAPQMQTVQNCNTQNFFETRTVAFNVVYEYAGKQYSVQTPNDPGPTIALQISPVGSAPGPTTQQPQAQAPVYQQPVYQQPVYQQPVYVQPPYPQQVIIAAPPSYPVVVARPYGPRYYPPVSLQFGWNYSEGRHGSSHGRNHWR